MPDVTISYKGSQIASMDASGTKTLLTEGKYCEDDIVVQYTRYSPEVYAGEHHQPTPSSYTVTVSLTNPVNAGYFREGRICEALSNNVYDTGNNIGSISSATGSTSVSVDPSNYGIAVVVDGISVYTDLSMCNCTGDVSAEDTDGGGAILFHVTGNGTITIDGIDYDD